jgi:hypothetical protein
MMRGTRVLGIGLGLVSVLAAQEALCCSYPAPNVHQVDTRLADQNAPAAPTDVVALVTRRLGQVCDDDGCVSQSCGDSAALLLEFNLAVDDQSPEQNVGYRLEPAGQPLPDYLAGLPTQRRQNGFWWHLPFAASAQLDTVAALVAIDEAGNESLPSEPFVIAFDGCTHPPIGESCYQEEEGSCAVGPAQRGAEGQWSVALGTLAVSIARLRRSRLRACPSRTR